MTKRTAKVVVAVTADIYKAQQRNHQHSSHHTSSGYQPANFQAEKIWVVVPGRISAMGQVRRRLLVVDGPLRKVHPNRLGLDLKKS